MSVELPVIILHLRAEVVDHVVNMLLVTVLILKELRNVVNLVPVESCSTCGLRTVLIYFLFFVFY